MFFTVFTPTYNRGYCIERVYRSLVSQKYSNFEWIVIDDGSSDNTMELLAGFQDEGKIHIVYQFQPNSGKHVAWNRAIELAQGEYFLCLDSDDEITSDALYLMWKSLCSSIQELNGIGILSQDQYGKKVGSDFPVDELIASINDMHFKHKCVEGEKSFCIKTAMLRKFPFPELKGLTHYPETWLWSRIPGKLIFINRRLRIYHVGAEDQITNNRPTKILYSHYLANLITINCLSQYFFYRPNFFIRNYVCISRFGLTLGYGLTKILSDTNSCFSKLLVLAVFPFGAYLKWKDKRTAKS